MTHTHKFQQFPFWKWTYKVKGEHKQTPWFNVVFLWGTNHYCPKLPGNANQLLDSRTSCWGWWVPFSGRWGTTWHITISEHLPNRWIGRTGQNEQVFCMWSLRSGDLTVYFLFGGKYRTSTTRNCGDDFQERITENVSLIKPDLLHRVWSKLDYCINVCRVMDGYQVCVKPTVTTWNFMSWCNGNHQCVKLFQ